MVAGVVGCRETSCPGILARGERRKHREGSSCSMAGAQTSRPSGPSLPNRTIPHNSRVQVEAQA